MSGAILLGLALGLRHAVDPDHVATLATLAARERRTRDAGFLGASWALGHGFVILSVGVLLLALRVSLPDGLARFAEAGAGVLLVGLGLANLALSHTQRERSSSARLGGALARSAGIGLLHGLAGSGAVTLVALSAFPTALEGGAYLASFSIGVAASMVGCSMLLGTPFARLQPGTRARMALSVATGLAAVLLGGNLVWSALLTDASWM
jgi:hypothetical protein